MVKIKICGLTNSVDAIAALEAGADALGFVFYEASPRHVGFSKATEIVRELPPFVSKVGVFVNPSRDLVLSAVRQCGLDAIQFHGDEPPEFCRAFAPTKAIKAFRIRGSDPFVDGAPYPSETWLLDGCVDGQWGGSGVRFDWEVARAVATSHRVILAGGLQPENVAEAIRKVQPYAVDVSSGVESAPGKKDHAKIRDFIAAVRAV